MPSPFTCSYFCGYDIHFHVLSAAEVDLSFRKEVRLYP